ncbi:tRNA pseudouridine(38-40) synthase TruA [Solimonas marina]|uniref:tRNA pseudouridine synthase A n=1 Tax=Solimonas marina TaxID=2714601 RepID=A0A969WCA0_9GAMM|nr:tRNA pseudouridine(38-40) synthase TruA [Solimonas marina]
MARFAAGVEYVGTGYCGWQALGKQKTLQAELERAMSRVADHKLVVTAAGRTDAGVHALQQVIHFDSDAQRDEYAWVLGTNSNVDRQLSLSWVRPVPLEFHARHRAIERSYRYVIHNRRARHALLVDRATWWPRPLDADAMREAAQVLLGEHDFSSFRDSECQAPTPVRELRRLTLRRHGEFVVLDIAGNAFLHHMVRNIVGTLGEVGIGRRPVEWVAEVLAARDRTRAGPTASAAGLYFVGPEYPAEFGLPKPPQPWFPGI